MSEQTPTTCAACGISFTHQGFGKYQDFCSVEHWRMGRAYCKQCNKPLIQGKNGRKDFCRGGFCQRRYYNAGGPIGQLSVETLLEEQSRTTCKCGCGMPITQSKNKNRRFYDRLHAIHYRNLKKRGLDLRQSWGGIAPQTRKAIRQVEAYDPILAKRLATAIEHEYRLHGQNGKYGSYIINRCKTCKKPFRRKVTGLRSKDYCNKCLSTGGFSMQGENNPKAKLTWKQVDEIRHLYATEPLTQTEIARRYNCNARTIGLIVSNQIWKPENDPRRKEPAP